MQDTVLTFHHVICQADAVVASQGGPPFVRRNPHRFHHARGMRTCIYPVLVHTYYFVYPEHEKESSAW